ncbi:MAG: hypothetical protein ACTH2Q_03000 [Propionibacteriaceae bacterium]
MSSSRFGGPAVRIVRETLQHSFVEPVRAGRVRPSAWPGPMQVTIIVSFVVYALLTLSVLLSGPLLAAHPGYNELGLSEWGWPIVTVGLWVTMVLLFLGTLRLNVWLRLAAWVLMAVPHLSTLFFALVDFVGRGPVGWLVLAGVLLLVLLGNVALIVLIALRARKPLRTSTVVTAAVALGATYLVPQLIVGRLAPMGSWGPALTAAALIVIGLPLAVAAGTAFSQISVNLSTYALASLREDVTPKLWLPLAVVLALAVGGIAGYRVRNLDTAVIVLSVVQVCLALVLAAAGLRLARRVGPFDVPRPTSLTEELGHVSMTLGILLGSWILPGMLRDIMPMPDVLADNAPAFSDFALALGALIMAGRAIRGGRTALATLLPAVAVMGAYAGVNTLFDLSGVNGSVANLAILAVLAGTAVFWSRRGGLTNDRGFVLCVGLLITLAFPVREVIAEPVAALLGFSSVGVLLFGLIWRLLTDGEFTHTESVRLPGGARVLVFLAYALFSATLMVAFVYGDPNSIMSLLDLDSLAGIGDAIIGYAVLPAVIIGLIELGWFHIDVADPEEMAAVTAP